MDDYGPIVTENVETFAPSSDPEGLRLLYPSGKIPDHGSRTSLLEKDGTINRHDE